MIHIVILLLAFLPESQQAGLDCLTIEQTSLDNITFTFGQNTSHLTKWNMTRNGKHIFGNLQRTIHSYSSSSSKGFGLANNKLGCHGNLLYKFSEYTRWDFKIGQEITYQLTMVPYVNQTWLTNSKVTTVFKLKATAVGLKDKFCLKSTLDYH